jgi:hypothetical protein
MSLESSEKYHDSSEKALKAEPTFRFYVLYNIQLNFGFFRLAALARLIERTG